MVRYFSVRGIIHEDINNRNDSLRDELTKWRSLEKRCRISKNIYQKINNSLKKQTSIKPRIGEQKCKGKTTNNNSITNNNNNNAKIFDHPVSGWKVLSRSEYKTQHGRLIFTLENLQELV